MKNILFLGDVHFGVRGDSELFRENLRKYFDLVLFPYLEKHKIKQIVQLGDMFDRRKYTNHLTLDFARTCFFDRLNELDIKLDILIGNHDAFYTNTNKLNTPELFLGEYKNVSIFHDPTERVINGIKFLYIPWINKENHETTYKLLESTDAKIAIGHLEINGFEMYEGSIGCQNGIEPSQFKRFDAVLSGHFHQPAEYSNIRYIGAITHNTFSDYGCERGCYIFNPHKGISDLEFLENPYSPYVKIYYEESIDIIDYNYSNLEGKIVKIIVTEKDDLDKYDLFIDMVMKSGVESYKIIDNSIYHYFESEVDDSILSEDTLGFVDNYIDSINVSNKGKVHSMFREIYLEAINLVITE